VQSLEVAAASDAEPGHAGAGAQARQLFLLSHQRDQVAEPLFYRKIRVLKSILLGVGLNSGKERAKRKE
jgi:hypothetical protein